MPRVRVLVLPHLSCTCVEVPFRIECASSGGIVQHLKCRWLTYMFVCLCVQGIQLQVWTRPPWMGFDTRRSFSSSGPAATRSGTGSQNPRAAASTLGATTELLLVFLRISFINKYAQCVLVVKRLMDLTGCSLHGSPLKLKRKCDSDSRGSRNQMSLKADEAQHRLREDENHFLVNFKIWRGAFWFWDWCQRVRSSV